MHARNLALPAAFLCLALAACGDDDDPRSPGVGSPGIVGMSIVPSSSLEGPWVVTSTANQSTCGPLNAVFETETVLTIVLAGNDFSFTMTDDCGNPLPGGTGGVDPTGAVEFTTEVDRNLTTTCLLHLTQQWTGFISPGMDVFNGSNVLSVVASAAPGSNNCGPSLPCTVTGTFQAERCPRTGCVVTCTP